MMIILWYFLFTVAYANEPMLDAHETIIVEGHRDIELYVAPIVMDIQSEEVEAVVAKKTVFSYTSKYWRGAKFKSPETGNYEPITKHTEIKVYDEDTIGYIWENCDYKIDPKKCAYLNDHMLLETIITVDDHQIVVNMILYDSDLTVLGSSIYTSDSKVKWIQQQEETVVQQQNLLSTQTIVEKPKEELPLKWLVPTNLLDKHIWQASALLWSGIRIN